MLWNQVVEALQKQKNTLIKYRFFKNVLVKLLNYCPPLIVSTLLILFAVISLFSLSPPTPSEFELRMEGARRPKTSLRSRLSSSPLLSSDPDSHLPGFPDHELSLDPKIRLVLQARVRMLRGPPMQNN